MESRDIIVDDGDGGRKVLTAVQHIDVDTAAELHNDLDLVSAAFHAARDGAAPDHGNKFDIAISMARSCVDELAREHTLANGA